MHDHYPKYRCTLLAGPWPFYYIPPSAPFKNGLLRSLAARKTGCASQLFWKLHRSDSASPVPCTVQNKRQTDRKQSRNEHNGSVRWNTVNIPRITSKSKKKCGDLLSLRCTSCNSHRKMPERDTCSSVNMNNNNKQKVVAFLAVFTCNCQVDVIME